MKFAQLHSFLSQNIGGTKDIMSPSVQKFGRTQNAVPECIYSALRSQEQIAIMI